MYSFFSSENPCPQQGNILSIRLSEGQELGSLPDQTQKNMLVDTFFQMNYLTGEWKRVKKYREIEEGWRINHSSNHYKSFATLLSWSSYLIQWHVLCGKRKMEWKDLHRKHHLGLCDLAGQVHIAPLAHSSKIIVLLIAAPLPGDSSIQGR